MTELTQEPWRETGWAGKVIVVSMPFILTVLSSLTLAGAGSDFGPEASAIVALASSLGSWVVTLRWAAGAIDITYPYWFFVALAMGMCCLSWFLEGRVDGSSSAASPYFLFALVGFAIAAVGAGLMWLNSRSRAA